MKNATTRTSDLRISYATYLRLSLGLSMVGLATQQAHADATWVGDSGQNWNTAASWSSDPANPTGNYFINTVTAGVFPIISANSAFTPVDLFIGNGAGASGRLDHTAGTAASGNGNWTFVGSNGGTSGTFNIANTAATGGTLTGFGQGSGSFTTGRLNVGGAEFNGNGTGTLNINTTGTITATAGSGTCFQVGVGTTSVGTVNMDSGTINATGGEVWVGGAGTGTFNQSGGTLSSNSYLVIGRGDTSANPASGTYNLSGGTVNAATTGGVAVIASSRNATATLAVSGTGTFNSTAGIYVGEGWQGTGTANGTLNVSGGGLVNTATNTANGINIAVQANSTGTVNLNGGTIQTAIVKKGAGNATFNFNGGTLKPTAASTTFMTGLSQAFVNAGGAIIDSNSFDITIGQDLLDGSGGLTKNGAGTLTLTGANNFTGATTVNTGTLTFAAKQSSIGSLSVANGAGLRVQAFDTFTTPVLPTALTLANGSALTFDFNSLNYSASTPLATTGVLNASGTVAVSLLNAGNLPSGTHKLIGYSSFTGGGTFSGAPFTLGTRSSGTLTNASGALSLTVTANSPKWSGLDNGNWVVGSTGSNKNWKLITGGAATDYIDGDVVLFDDSVTTGTTNVNISAANVSPATTTFNNDTKNYILGSTGAFGIAGTGPFTKSGAGALVITSANTYTGLTSIASGSTLTLGNGTTGNDGTIANTSGVANEGTLAFNRFGSTTANYLISGNGSVTKTGPGTQILTAANTYFGGTTVNAGTLQINTTAGDAANGTFNLGGGSFLVNLGTGTNFGYAPQINLNAASTFGNASAGSNTTLEGQINFSGTVNGNSNALNIANTGLARLYMNGTLTDVSQINVLSGAMGFDLNAAQSRGTSPVDIASGASLWLAGNNVTPVVNNLTFHGGSGIGTKGALYYEGGTPNPAALTGTVQLASGTTATGAAFAADTITIDGVVSGTGGLNVTSGGLSLGGANGYLGGTTVTLGRAIAKTSTAFGTGAVATSAATGVQVQLGAGVNVANALTLGGASFTGQGTLYVPTGDATSSGAISITGDTTTGGHFATGGGTLTVSGAVTSSVPVKVRNGIVAFTNAASSYTGMIVQQGTAKLGVNNAIPTASTVDLGVSGAAILDLGGFNQSLAGLTKNTNAATVTNSGASDSTLTTTGTTTFNGVIQNGATHKTALTVGGGTLTLGGANTFTGNVTVNTGLTLADNAQLRFTPGPNNLVNSIGGNGTLTLDGDFVIDLAGASVANGNTWTLVNVGSLTETFSATFSVVDFTENANVWTKVDGANTWTFSEATGVLSLSVGASGYGSWATANAGGQTEDQDYDGDGVKNGVEFFFGATGSTFTANPQLVSGTITWPKSASFTGTYKVSTSTDLATWADVTINAVDNGTSVSYTPVGGQQKRFVRLEVTPN
ncbi:beta strand repeat-containing protein [Luteolibacter soli]|uniref:Autotransporter-associated beta strand repeat-containing protein n=1 Tax=Luteolibacter soli TaxID=3135280 RepID=A0ABU9AUI1_9BACT